MGRLRPFRIASVLALVAFHVSLLWGRFADASILEPAVLLRWLGTSVLFGGVMAYQRWAPKSLRGRRAWLVFWLLAAVLHIGVPVEAEDANLALALLIPVAAVLAAVLTTGRVDAAIRFHAVPQIVAVQSLPRRLSDPRGPPRR